jgi:hypothetical protein
MNSAMHTSLSGNDSLSDTAQLPPSAVIHNLSKVEAWWST